MFKQFEKAGIRLWALASVTFTMSACGVFWAGGVDEETNTVAGVSEEETRSPDSYANLGPIESNNDVDIIVDTTYLPPRQDITPPPQNTIINVDPTPTPADTVSAGIPTIIKKVVKVYLADKGSADASMELSLRDSVAVIQSGANGAFEIEELPDGTYSFVLKYNGYGHVSETTYFLKNESNSIKVLGPVPTDLAEDIDADDLIAPPVQTVEMPDVVGCTPSPDPVEPEPEPGCDTPSDSTTISVGNPDGMNNDKVGLTVEMPHDLDYGIVYHWEGDKVPANGSTVEDNLVFAKDLKELTFEVTFKINSFMESTFYSRNIFGKKGLFNLAITKSACYVPQPALTFFIGNGFEFSSCHDKAVISSATLEAGKEITVTGVWKGKQVMLYMDGFLIAEQILTQISDINYITADDILETPFVFGNSDLDITILDARLGNKAISSADVLYRHYLKGGAQ